MYVRKSYGYVIFEDQSLLSEKGKLDSFDPITVHSARYKSWVTVDDNRRCLACRSMKGKVYRMGEIEEPSPPLHPNCRCRILPMEAIVAGNATKDGKNGADWWLEYLGILPDYYITKEELERLGWDDGKNPSKYAPGKMLTKGVYKNDDGHLPEAPNRIWYEADINYTPGRRNRHRVLWSNDGLIFVTYDHYETFYEIVS